MKLNLPAMLFLTLLPLFAIGADAAEPVLSALRTSAMNSIDTKLIELGAELTQSNGVVTKVFFKDCSKLGDAEFRLIGQLKDLKSLLSSVVRDEGL